MALDSEKFKAYNALRKNESSESDPTGAKNGTISGQGGGLTFERGNSLTFEPITDDGELDIRKNSSLTNDVWTCTAVNQNGELLEIWPSMIGRTIPEYINTGNNGFNPTGTVKSSTPPQGNIRNAYDFWNKLKGKTIYCVNVEQVNTLSYDRTRIVNRKVFTWSYNKPEG